MAELVRPLPRQREDFQIAIICTLGAERDAVEALFDQHWRDTNFGKAEGDPNAYINGRIGHHDVVLALLPGMGKVRSASVAAALCTSYTQIRLCLVVGVCGGTPNTITNEKILLGDVLISSGIVQYDFGRQLHDGFLVKDSLQDSLARPNPSIGAFLNKISGQETTKQLREKVSLYMSDIFRKNGFAASRYPGIKQDKLYQPHYQHRHHQPTQCHACNQEQINQGTFCEIALRATCNELGCSDDMLLDRDLTIANSHRTVSPELHRGIFASGDQIVRSALFRDSLSRRYNVIGFEMEGAGVWDTLPTLIVKGVSDYADSHKNKKWQNYAAVAAAAFTKALLAEWIATDVRSAHVPHLAPERKAISNPDQFVMPFNPNDIPLARGFVCRESELNQIDQALKPNHGDCLDSRRLFSLYGLGGIGKTQLAARFAQANKGYFSAILWLEGSSLDSIKNSFSKFASLLQTPTKRGLQEAAQQEVDIRDVLAWLAYPSNKRWLMVFDNVDLDIDAKPPDPQAYDIRAFFPPADHGSILITSRLESMYRLGSSTKISRFALPDSKKLIEKRLGRSFHDEKLAETVIERLDGHALALTMAASYIYETGISFEDYYLQYTKAWSELVEQQDEYPLEEYGKRTMLAAWQLSYNQLERQSIDAARLLKLLAFFDRTGLEYDIFSSGLELELSDDYDVAWLKRICKSRLTFTSHVRLLRRYSLIEQTDEKDGFSVHSVLHEWIYHLISRRTEKEFDATYRLAGQLIARQALRSEEQPNFGRTARKLMLHATRWISRSQLMRRLPDFPIEDLVLIGGFLLSSQNLSGAEAAFLQALQGCEKTSCQDKTLYLFIRGELGSVYHHQGKMREAERTLTRVLQDHEHTPELRDVDIHFTMDHLANLYLDEGRFEDAEDMFQRVLETSQNELEPNDKTTLAAWKGLGHVYLSSDKLSEAEAAYNKALQGQITLARPEDAAGLDIFSQLGSVYLKQGELRMAEEAYMRVLNGMESQLGPENTETLKSVLNVGDLYFEQGKNDEAERAYTRALHGFEKALGPHHSTTLNVAMDTGRLYAKMGRFKEAEEMQMRALDGLEGTLGPDNTETLASVMSVAKLHFDQDKLDQAAEFYRRAFQGFQKMFGLYHSSTLTALTNIGIIYARWNNFTEAEQTYMEALHGEESTHGFEDKRTLEVVRQIGRLYFKQGRLAEAREYFVRALPIFERALGPEHKRTRGIQRYLKEIQRRLADGSPELTEGLSASYCGTTLASPQGPEI